MFASKRNLEILRECDHWYADGTFKVSPTIFTQLFTILGSVPAVVGDPNSEKIALPLVYALLSSKQEVQYEAVYKAVQAAAEEYGIPDFAPKNIMSDFERAIINAALSVFPDIDVLLCFFHLKQSAYRHVQSLGLQRAYNDLDDSSVRDFCHMMAALAFVPVRHVKTASRALKNAAPNVPGIPEFISYFSETYVNGIPGASNRRRVPPRFDHSLWNMY